MSDDIASVIAFIAIWGTLALVAIGIPLVVIICAIT